ncbi:hypothetical protein M9434_003482 [Picochlorum sp. BPE23]|nr:hypothetical protein M9434_003482 [Picochlorum sp. BPE23]
MSVNEVAQCDVPGGSGEGGQGNFKESATRPLENQGTSTTNNSKRKRVKRSDAVEVKKERKKRRSKKQVGSNENLESEGLTCAVCCEALTQPGTKSNTSIECPSCQYQACVKCVERYILDMREGQPQCMNPDCQAEWHTSFLRQYFATSWINGPYYKARSQYHLKMEMAKLPEDHESLLNYRHCNQLAEDIKVFNTELKELKRQLDEKKQIISFTNNMIREYKTSQYLVNLRDVEPEAHSSRHGQFPCQDEQCKGFLHKETHVCNICDKITCKNCHILLGKESDEETVEHVCKEEDIETAKLLRVNTKPCPYCNMGVYKIEGCSQMFCTACKTAFGWNSGKIIKSNIHNPHYFDWRREQAEDGVIPRQPGDRPGEQVEENQREIYGRHGVPRLSKTDLWKRLGCLEPGMQLTLRAGVDTHGGERAHIEDSLKNMWVDNMEVVLKFVKTLMAEIADIEERERPDAPRIWRLYYANNDVSERAFKNQLIKIDKKESKSKELKHVLTESARYIATQLSNVTESLESMDAAWAAVKKETSQLDRKLVSIRICFGGPIPEDGQFSHVLRAIEFAKRLKREDAYPALEEDALMERDMSDLYYDPYF